MLRKSLFILVAMIALYSLGAGAAFAQTGQLRGHVVFKPADGTTIPAAEAVIDVYRTDISGTFQTKTNKKGQFVFAGLPFVGTYAIVVSMSNAQPTYQAGVKAGRDVDYELVLYPGDGRRFTQAEVKAAIAGGGDTSSSGGSTRESAADKAKREELIKKNEEIAAANRKAGEVNEIVARTFKLGNEALKAKNYEEAIKLYREGLAADAEQAALLTNLSVALRARGVDRYNVGIQSKDEAVKNSAIQDFRDAADAGSKGVELLNKMPAGTTPDEQTRQTTNKYFALVARAEAMRLVATKVDPAQADAGLTAFHEYIAVETDAVKKKRAELDAARMLLDAGASEKSLAEYRKILATNPDDPDANFGAGLAMFGADNKESYQQAANYLQHFVDVAPDSHQFKEEAKGILAELKNTQKVEPVRTTPRRGSRRP